MLGIITVSKSGLLKLKLMRLFFFMYEQNLFSQIFPRVNHSLGVRKLTGKSSTIFRCQGATCLQSIIQGGWEKQTHLSLGIQAKVFFFPNACCDYAISGISLPLLIWLNSTITENPPGERSLAGCCGRNWGDSGIPGGGGAKGWIQLWTCPGCGNSQSRKGHPLDIHTLWGKQW